MPTFASSLVTPERIVFEEEVAAVILRTDVGDATFLAGHTPLIGSIVPGLVRFQREDGSEDRVAVHGGLVHVRAEGVSVLAPVAEMAADIDVERARRAQEVAEQAVTDATGRPAGAGEDDLIASRDLAEAQAALQRAQVRLEVADS
ncbi:MAG TPA: ATP synthase F1 subunit epsilon [Acidimicrobiales bacterium]|nr:ATP synthase F1 subunit epsilon [Acidimicrobiales bacterium]